MNQDRLYMNEVKVNMFDLRWDDLQYACNCMHTINNGVMVKIYLSLFVYGYYT